MEIVAKKENLLISWILWQFFEMPKFLFEIWSNYFSFAFNLFSLPLLIKTFFSPWRKYKWNYPIGFDIVEFFNTIISNTISRFLGAFMRSILIIFGIGFQFFIAIIGFIILTVWMLFPLIIISGFLFILFF